MTLAKKLLKDGEGVLRLAPTWVSRSFCRPAKRIKLHPDDYYVLGQERGGIDERRFASTKSYIRAFSLFTITYYLPKIDKVVLVKSEE